MKNLRPYLEGHDLRSIGNVDGLVPLIRSQSDFDALFRFLQCGDRLLEMRAIDAVEKISVRYPEFLVPHRAELEWLLSAAVHKEFKWHLALLIPRLAWDAEALPVVWAVFEGWATDQRESKLVRVHALQALYDLSAQHRELSAALETIMETVGQEGIASIDARIRKLRKAAAQRRQMTSPN